METANVPDKKKKNPHLIQHDIFVRQTGLIVALALVLTIAGCLIMVIKEIKTDDQNLMNIASAVAHAKESYDGDDEEHIVDFFDSLKGSLTNIDAISIVDTYGVRVYHSNHSLIGTKYDGTFPDFANAGSNCYAENSTGPSGIQRRAYSIIRNSDGSTFGFVIAVMLRANIISQILNIVLIFLIIMLVAIGFEITVSHRLSAGIKKSLMGYEPDAFSAMFTIRDNVLESLKEGIIAVDAGGEVRFINAAAAAMLGKTETKSFTDNVLGRVLETGKKEMNLQPQLAEGTPVIVDCIPVMENDSVAGAAAILHDRKEYTKLMEDLAGTRYLVDSMRANNHDFTNKLHVILGLIQMDKLKEAASYIENITLTRQEIISKIMHTVDDPTIAALLIGKTVKASEMNVKFTIQEGSAYHYADYPLPQESLNTIIGNLIDNAYDAMNVEMDYNEYNQYYPVRKKELLFGIFSKPGALMITVDDTGMGMSRDVAERIFENGFSTKGENRGTGLYQSKLLIDSLGGNIVVDSLPGTGTSFTVTFAR